MDNRYKMAGKWHGETHPLPPGNRADNRYKRSGRRDSLKAFANPPRSPLERKTKTNQKWRKADPLLHSEVQDGRTTRALRPTRNTRRKKANWTTVEKRTVVHPPHPHAPH